MDEESIRSRYGSSPVRKKFTFDDGSNKFSFVHERGKKGGSFAFAHIGTGQDGNPKGFGFKAFEKDGKTGFQAAGFGKGGGFTMKFGDSGNRQSLSISLHGGGSGPKKGGLSMTMNFGGKGHSANPGGHGMGLSPFMKIGLGGKGGQGMKVGIGKGGGLSLSVGFGQGKPKK